jgi:GlpG protein
MLWLLILGKQMERKISIPRYLLFMLLVGIFSNTMQYLMSGSDFIGFSGILTGMITFVWFRQKKAPWEGYQLQPATMGFITVFILGIAGLQMISFFMEISGARALAPQIANTAHLSGAFLGYLFSKVPFFAWTPKSRI